MVEINEVTIGETKHKQFSLLNDGFHPSGFVLMECRNSDMDCEGNAFFIDITTDMAKHENDKIYYSPLEMDKSELKQFIEYLQEIYKELP